MGLCSQARWRADWDRGMLILQERVSSNWVVIKEVERRGEH